MSSMFADYIRERTEDLILETNEGFATYRYLSEKTCYIIDIYVKPDFRKMGYAAAIADLIAYEAKNKGCTEILGTVLPTAKHATTSLKVLLGYGMTLKAIDGGLIVFRKDI